MSGWFQAREKIAEGKNWRGTINAPIGDDVHDLTVRQLRDKEWYKVRRGMNTDGLKELREDLDEEKSDRYRELQGKDELSDDEKEEMKELEDELASTTQELFDALDEDTFDAVVFAAKCALEPSEEDAREFLELLPQEKADIIDHLDRDEASRIRDLEDAKRVLRQDMKEMVDYMTGFSSFSIGMRAIRESTEVMRDDGDSGN